MGQLRPTFAHYTNLVGGKHLWVDICPVVCMYLGHKMTSRVLPLTRICHKHIVVRIVRDTVSHV
jgi:hypothetical protein